MKWNVPADLDAAEALMVERLGRKAKFYVFLRSIRAQLFNAEFEAELEKAYRRPGGQKPLPAAMLATVTLLQAYEQAGDFEAVENAEMDKRWQLVLGCLGAEKAPFSQGVLSQFRARMVEHDLDKKLLARTVELAKASGDFGWQHLKFALDSSPLLGAGRVEDTWNLIGRALSTVVDCAAKCFAVPREQILREAKLTLLCGPSLKASLDIDWDDLQQKAAALQHLIAEVDSVRAWVNAHGPEQANKGALCEALDALERVLTQDIEPDPEGGGFKIRRGVAKDRMPSLGDSEMRHGRKSKSKLFNGYKRHIATVASTGGVIVAATVLPANQPEHQATASLLDQAEQHGNPDSVLIDRGYLGSSRIAQLRSEGKLVLCKPWPSRNGGRFTKEDFVIDLPRGELTCPAGQKATIAKESLMARFDSKTCRACALRSGCTSAEDHGRTVSIHPHEELLIELRVQRRTPEGRRALRQRVEVEHSLARLGAIQGTKARYKGARNNELDVRRCAAVANLQVVARQKAAA